MADNLFRSYSLEKSSEGVSGSYTFYEDSPASPFDIGDTFRPVDGGPLLNVDKVSIKDNVIGVVAGKVKRQWQITVEGSSDSKDTDSGSNSNIAYTFTIDTDEKSGSMEVTNKGSNPVLRLAIGDKFNIPGIGQVTCNQVKGSDSYDDNGAHLWTVTYEGSTIVASSGSDSDLPETELTISYEINGTTARSVAGEFIALRRSESPITKKSFTVYSKSIEPVTTPGSKYQGGIVTGENISKEVIKTNDVITKSYYKHDIEVEL